MSDTNTPADPTVRRSASIGKLAAALVKAQAELRNPPKDSVNPHFKSRYADLATVRDCVLPVLNRHGLALVQLPCEVGADAALTTLLAHDSGEWVETTMRTRPVKGDPQALGSALTYARRYSLQAVAGVAAEDDDDAQAASRPAPAAARQTKAPPATPPAEQPGDAAEPDPVNRQPDLAALAKSRGQTWANCVTRINAEFGTRHAAKVAFADVEPLHRKWLVGQLDGMPTRG